jgi:hypothetical protein
MFARKVYLHLKPHTAAEFTSGKESRQEAAVTQLDVATTLRP